MQQVPVKDLKNLWQKSGYAPYSIESTLELLILRLFTVFF